MPQTYRILRSDRRTVSLELTPEGETLVRAPKRMSAREIERFVEAHAAWLFARRARQAERRAAQPAPLTRQQVEMLRARAKRELPARVAAYAAAMGVTPAGVRITSARTRFGSCNAKNSLCFSCYLMANAQPAIDYVIVHELAHIRHKNHSAAFWAEVAKVFPDYRTRRAMLFMPALEKETM